MFNIRKYSYVILWAALILVVAVVWLFGRDDVSAYISDKSAISETTQDGEQSAKSKTEESSGQESSASTAAAGESTIEETATDTETGELIGLWVPYMSLVTEEKTEAAFKAKFEQIVLDAKEKGINALFVHVRPFSDALYPSDYYPWSHILTGQQGTDPGYDPLAFMIECAHNNQMEFHAWLNPLRVKTSDSPQTLSADSPYSMLQSDYPYYFMEYEGGIYLNPAYQYVRTLIANGAAEIVRNYDVDGIHFDDYFYPTEDGGIDSVSYESYTTTVTEPLSLSEWRSANISAMVSEVYSAVKQEKQDVVFGISPGGNIANNTKIGANVQEWCAVPGYIDYICPQIYYSYDNPALGYLEALESWVALDRHEGLKLYIGLALYKAGSDADEGTWQLSSDNIQRQIVDARVAGSDGIILYAYDYLNKTETQQEVENAMAVLDGSSSG